MRLIHLTRQQICALALVLFVLVVGWGIRAWRLAHPSDPVPSVETTKPDADLQF